MTSNVSRRVMPPAVSHEEPDIEPKSGAPDIAVTHPPELRGDLDVTTVVCGILVAAIMGASYPYMVLKLGFGPNVSVVAAFFGFLILNLMALVGGGGYDRWQNNIVQTAGTSAAQT